MKGIYYYKDKETGLIDYIGKDSNISKNIRYNAHKSKAYYNDQPFNRVLQNNPDKYDYRVFCKGNFTDEALINLERRYKLLYKPRFDFEYRTHGGLTEQHKQKISEARKGFKHKESSKKLMSERHYDCAGDKNPRYRHDLPTSKELWIENKNGATYEYLSNKYECGESTIYRHIKKYKDTIKDKPQLTTHGTRADGKIMYCIYWNGTYVKYSVYKSELIEWFENKYNEPVICF